MRHTRTVFVVALSCLPAALLAAGCARSTGQLVDTPSPITIEQLLAIRETGEPAWSPDGRHVAFEWGTGAERALWAAEVTTARAAQRGAPPLRQIAPLTERGAAVLSPDWQWIAYVSKRHIWRIPADGGRPQQLTKDEGKYSGLNWAPDSSQLAFVRDREDQSDIGIVSREGALMMLAESDSDEDSPIWAPQSDRLAFIRRFDNWQGYDIWVATPNGSARRRVVTERYGSRAGDPEERHIWVVNAAGGEPVRISPEGFTAAPAWSRDGRHLTYLRSSATEPPEIVMQPFAINWRGTHVGYGNAFEQANYRDYGGGELDDVAASAEFLAREAGVDRLLIACWGTSYGGYMTMLAVTKAPDVCRAGVSLYGVSDWAEFLKQSKRKLWRSRLLSKLVAPGNESPLYERAAAIRYVSHARSPLLILQGLDDDGVVPAQGEALYAAMRAAGKSVDYVAYVGEGHGFRPDPSRRDLYTRVESFLQRHNARTPATTE